MEQIVKAQEDVPPVLTEKEKEVVRGLHKSLCRDAAHGTAPAYLARKAWINTEGEGCILVYLARVEKVPTRDVDALLWLAEKLGISPRAARWMMRAHDNTPNTDGYGPLPYPKQRTHRISFAVALEANRKAVSELLGEEVEG